MRWTLAIVLAGLFASAARADEGGPRYEIRPGTLSGLPATAPNSTPPVTILLDHQTGRTWLLAVIDGEVRWQALPFGKGDSADVMPPMAKSDLSDRELRGGGIYKP
ncbi:hypothetical protein [Aureimonas leprariae]|uniref:Uncharacterized protein n=1 Tax=Plantimonas leprariae TaxID=2615207 RepID=A0A7V7TY20_9HYPH|nr:hypothetical protein [Aureimonas leprariae]KAB0681861.1 hypothetical protein F6X38_03305 [Aureimonas leprariae]